MRIMRKMNSAFSFVRACMIVTVACNISVAMFCWAYCHFFNVRQNDRIYRLTGEIPVMIALGQNVKENRQAEAKAELKRFHKLFFALVPDESEIKHNMQEAMLMADISVTELYSDLEQSGYYRQICEANIRCSYACDSIRLDIASYPYEAVIYGKTSIVRTSGTTIRELVTACSLRNVLRTEETPHGFLIENFKVLQNEDSDANSIF